MISFAEDPKPVRIVDKNGNPILTKDHARRFLKQQVHKKDGLLFKL